MISEKVKNQIQKIVENPAFDRQKALELLKK